MASAKPGSRGRVTPSQKQIARQGGRYTPPIPREKRHSPSWFPFVLVGLLVLGLAVIIGNYANVLPGGTHDWYLIGGIAAIVAGLIMATYYH
ncbi:MAG: cell division protein CrgA [Acidimicrobiales bacterium]